MQICAKCGRSYEGTSGCPWCEAPEILVNQDDYKRRKLEFEANEKKRINKEERKKRNIEELRKFAVKLARTDLKKSVKDSNIGKYTAKNKKRITATIGFITFAAVLFVCAKILFPSGNLQLYSMDSNYIYHGTVLDSHECTLDSVAFDAMGTHGYAFTKAKELNNQEIVDIMASADGKYFAFVAYREEKMQKSNQSGSSESNIGESNSQAVNGNLVYEGNYTLFVQKKDSSLVVVDTGLSRKSLVFLSNDGILIYTDTSYMNEGAIETVKLEGVRIFENSKESFEIAKDYRQLLVTDKGKNLFYINSDLELYKMAVENKNITTNKVAGFVERLYSAKDLSGMYEYSDISINDADSKIIYYTSEGEYIFDNNLTGKKAMKKQLFKNSDKCEKIYFNEEYNKIIFASNMELVEVDNKGNFNVLDKIKSSSDIYYNGDNCIYYINALSELYDIKIKKNTCSTQKMAEGVYSESLKSIVGDKKAFSYKDNDGRHYCSDSKNYIFSSDAEKIVLYNHKLYYINDGKMYASYQNGKKNDEYGKIKNIWLGKVTV